ncbi:MAG: hypothetical protein ACYDB4_20040 [Candidatus Dormibacteraceae bacterium]
MTWEEFLAAHAHETLPAADFFGGDTIFFKRLYVLLYVDLIYVDLIYVDLARHTWLWSFGSAESYKWEPGE